MRGLKDRGIDYCGLAMYERELIVQHIGIKQTVKKNDYENMEYAQDLFGKEQDLTRFCGHNAMYHLLLDQDKIGNVYLAQCKTLEKTNKTTKDALRKGKVSTNLCNRIMRYNNRRLVVEYLCEGNGVDDEGHMDPINGKNKIDENILQNLKRTKWLSPFADMRIHPGAKEYSEGSELKGRIKRSNPNSLQCSYVNHADLNYVTISNVITNKVSKHLDDGKDIKWFKELYIWRKYKRIKLAIGSLIKSKGASTELLLITGLMKATTDENIIYELAVGHEVILDTHYQDGDKNPRATIQGRLMCWKIDEIECKVMYYHLCDEFCSISEQEITHQWEAQPRIVIFWWTGMGKAGIGDPLGRNSNLYDTSRFRYR